MTREGYVPEQPDENADLRTAAECKFEESLAKREQERIAKLASKSHKTRVKEFNEYLANLSGVSCLKCPNLRAWQVVEAATCCQALTSKNVRGCLEFVSGVQSITTFHESDLDETWCAGVHAGPGCWQCVVTWHRWDVFGHIRAGDDFGVAFVSWYLG